MIEFKRKEVIHGEHFKTDVRTRKEQNRSARIFFTRMLKYSRVYCSSNTVLIKPGIYHYNKNCSRLERCILLAYRRVCSGSDKRIVHETQGLQISPCTADGHVADGGRKHHEIKKHPHHSDFGKDLRCVWHYAGAVLCRWGRAAGPDTGAKRNSGNVGQAQLRGAPDPFAVCSQSRKKVKTPGMPARSFHGWKMTQINESCYEKWK